MATEEHVYSIGDLIIIVVGILIVVLITVLDFFFCSYFHGFCAVRYFFTFVGTAILKGVVNPAAKLIVGGVLRMIDLIPL